MPSISHYEFYCTRWLRLLLFCFSGLCTFVLINHSSASVAYARSGKNNIALARKALKKGRAAIKRKRYMTAIGHYKEAQRRDPDLKNVITIANLYSKIKGHCVDAYAAWRQAEAECQGCKQANMIQDKMESTTTTCAGWFTIDVFPPTDVVIDGVNLGRSPLSYLLLKGSHELTLNKRGFQPFRQLIFLRDQPLAPLKINLLPNQPAFTPQKISYTAPPPANEKSFFTAETIGYLTSGLLILGGASLYLYTYNEHTERDQAVITRKTGSENNLDDFRERIKIQQVISWSAISLGLFTVIYVTF